MQESKNYFQHLMVIKKSDYTEGATLVLDIKHGSASIKFKNERCRKKFDASLPEVYEKVDFMKILKIAGQLAMDVDGDTVVLDLFIAVRDQFDLE